MYLFEMKDGKHCWIIRPSDVPVADSLGVPYVICPDGVDIDIMKMVLIMPYARKLLPELEWNNIIEHKSGGVFRSVGDKDVEDMIMVCQSGPADSGTEERGAADGGNAIEVTGDYRTFDGAGGRMRQTPMLDYFDVDGFTVNIDELQAIGMLPEFVDEVLVSSVKDIDGCTSWQDGYTRKLGVCLGETKTSPMKRNLIILDVSCSIPDGISFTMCRLLETLKEKAGADVILTSGTSHYYPYEDPLPSMERMRRIISTGNESRDFERILKTNVAGNHYGNVIVFGDNDSPFRMSHNEVREELNKAGTSIDNVLLYHTYSKSKCPGYGLWMYEAGLVQGPLSVNTDWCQFISNKRC